MRNRQQSRDRLLYQAIDILGEKMPSNWRVRIDSPTSVLSQEALRLRVVAPTGRWTRVTVTSRQRLDPRGVIEMAHGLLVHRALGAAVDLGARTEPPATHEVPLGRGGREPAEDPAMEAIQETPTVLLASRYLTRPVREKLRELGFAYVDLTGHRYLALSDPGIVLETSGAAKAPDRVDRPARSLRGPRAGRIVRALCDFVGPAGVRALAARAGVDPGYVSRVCTFLDRELLIERGRRGRIERVQKRDLLERWAQDAPLATRGTRRGFVEPGGFSSLLPRLLRLDARYALTHSAAAWLYLSHGASPDGAGDRRPPDASAPALVEPPRRAVIYVENLREAPAALGLHPVDLDANVYLIDPRDDGVFDRSEERGGIRLAAPTQVVADLLGSGGRGPAEAAVLLRWLDERQAT